jgi:Tfp pilus assembly protein PilE
MYDILLEPIDATTYQLTATPRAGNGMATDPCGTYILRSDGQRTAAGANSGSAFEKCWNR